MKKSLPLFLHVHLILLFSKVSITDPLSYLYTRLGGLWELWQLPRQHPLKLKEGYELDNSE